MAIKASMAKAVRMLFRDVRNCGFIGRSFGGLQFHRSKGMFGQNRKTFINLQNVSYSSLGGRTYYSKTNMYFSLRP